MASAATTRWTIEVPKELDSDLRDYLSRESGDASPAAVSGFITESVNMRLLDLSVQKIRRAFSDLSEKEIQDLVDEAIAWARSPEGRACEWSSTQTYSLVP